MHISSDLCELLQCPISSGPIEDKDGKYYSPGANLKIDNYEGLPWIFRNPKIHLYQWQQHIKNILVSMAQDIEFIDTEINISIGTDETKQRLAGYRNGIRHNSEEIVKILSSFLSQDEVNKPVFDQLSLERLPSTQHLNSYFNTLFRDWAWGSNETSHAFDLVGTMFKRSPPEKLLVLGTGASRLAFDLHNEYTKTLTVGMDINPLLLMSAKKIIFDDPITLFEMPIAPMKLDDSCVRTELKRPAEVKSGFNLLFGDGLNPPFKRKSVDAVLTPWFIDIIPMDFQILARKINEVLDIGGKWYNFGPLGYSQPLKAQSYSTEEIQALLEESGFKIVSKTIKEIDYLVSPHSSQGRKEKVFLFDCEKIRDSKETPFFHYLPPWIAQENVAIPRLSGYDELQIKNKTYSELLNCIDGQRSQNEIIPLMVKHYGMEENIAREALGAFLINLFEGRG